VGQKFGKSSRFRGVAIRPAGQTPLSLTSRTYLLDFIMRWIPALLVFELELR